MFWLFFWGEDFWSSYPFLLWQCFWNGYKFNVCPFFKGHFFNKQEVIFSIYRKYVLIPRHPGEAIPSMVFSEAPMQIQCHLTPKGQRPQEQPFSSLVILLLLDFITLRLHCHPMMKYAPCKIRLQYNNINRRICNMLEVAFHMTENTGSSDIMIIKTLILVSRFPSMDKEW